MLVLVVTVHACAGASGPLVAGADVGAGAGARTLGPLVLVPVRAMKPVLLLALVPARACAWGPSEFGVGAGAGIGAGASGPLVLVPVLVLVTCQVPPGLGCVLRYAVFAGS